MPLRHFLAEQLGAYLADRPHGPGDLVFTMPGGGPLRASKWGERYFRPAVAAAGLPEALRVPDLRHTAAYPSDLDALAERLDRAHAAAATAELWPQGGPAVVRLSKGQVNDLALWWRWGDSNSLLHSV